MKFDFRDCLIVAFILLVVLGNCFAISYAISHFQKNDFSKDASYSESSKSSYDNFEGSGLSKKDFIIREAMKLAPSRANVCAEYEFVDGDETKAIKCFYRVYYSEIEE